MKFERLKEKIGKLLGIKEWKLNEEGRLDVSKEELARLKSQYGEDFVTKFEKFLAEEAQGTEPREAAPGAHAEELTGILSTEEEDNTDTNKNESDMLKLELLCALLAVESITLSDDGNATLSKEQLEAVEAGLKKLQDEKLSAESNLTSANADKDAAEKALSDAVTAMDDLDSSVAAAETPAAKVEAIRKKLAEKPGAAATGAQAEADTHSIKIEGADPATNYIDELT